MKITNGSVTYSHVVKIDEYGVNKKAEVTLSFECDDTLIEDTINTAAALAKDTVRQMLTDGKKPAAKPELVKPADVVPITPVEPPLPVEVIEKAVAAAEVPITDKDLHAAATRKNEAIKNPVAIRKLVAEYNPDPGKTFSMNQIPAGKRKEFLEKLDKLTPVAG